MSQPNWDDLALFLGVVRDGRLTGAARTLGINQATVARRLGALEAGLGARLFDRSPRGVRLTDAGTILLHHAERIEAEMEAALANLGGTDTSLSGSVRLSTPEAFGTAIVAPAAAAFRAAYPALTLELLPESRAVSLANREADVAVTLTPPPRGRLSARRLTDYRLGLYAAADYLAKHRPIADLADLAGHDFTGYIDTVLDLPQLHGLDEVRDGIIPGFRSSSSVAQHAAVAGGQGIGLLHHFIARDDPRLRPVVSDRISVVRSYWLTVHDDRRHLPRVRALIGFIDGLVRQHRTRF